MRFRPRIGATFERQGWGAAGTAFVVSSLAFVLAGEVRGQAPAAELASPEILFHADLDGRLAEPLCDRTRPPTTKDTSARRSPRRPGYPNLVAAVISARTAAAERNAPEPIVLLGGNLATPDPLGRGVLEHQPDGPARLATLFSRAAYDAIALGHHDLSLPQEQLQRLVDALRTRGMPVVLSNLSCAAPRTRLCETTRRYVLVRRGPVTVAVVATISPSVLPGIAPALRAGLTLGDPQQAIRDVARQARAAGANRVVVMTQGPRDHRGLDEIDALQRALVRGSATVDGSGWPALILAGGLWDEESGSALRMLRRDGAPPVVGAEGGSASLSRVNWSSADGEPSTALGPGFEGHSDGDQQVIGTPARGAVGATTGDSATAALLAPELTAYCERFDVAIASAPVRTKLSRESFTRYALEVMRRRADAELALINRAAVKRTPFPLAGALTAGDLERAMPYSAVIGVASLSGASLEELLGPALTNAKLVAVGVVKSGGGLQVNGRPLDKARQYRVATIAFVATGGDGILPSKALPWRPLDGAPELRETIAAFLRTETGRRDGDPSVDAATDFGRSPDVRPLLVGITDVGLDFSDTHIANGAGYGDAQLVRAQQRVLKGEGTGLLQLRQPRHEVDARLNLKYGWTRSRPPNAPLTSGETTDLITFTTVYNYRGLRARPEHARPGIPDPYLRVSLESELTRPPLSATQTRGFHHLELTNTAGALFTLAPALRVRGGVGARKELLTGTTPLGRWRPLLEAGATLSPVALASFGPLALRLEGLVDYNFIDPTGVREHQLRLNSKVSIPLVPLLFLTAGIDMFAVQRERQGWGASYDTTIGLRVHLDAAHQWM